MKTSIADERILLFSDQISPEQAAEIAQSKKAEAFGTISRVVSFLSKPNDTDFILIYSEHRYEPIWHVSGEAKYVYDRKTSYDWSVSGKEVQELTVLGKKFPVVNGKVQIEGKDHCFQEEQFETWVEGLTAEKKPPLQRYTDYLFQEIDKKELEKLTEEKKIFVPPVARASAIVRELLNSAVKVIEADEIFEERIDITHVDLYYRPVYAFQYQWISKEKEAIVEIDGLTGEVSYGKNIFKEYLGKALNKEFLLDVGTDAVDLFIPGSGLAVKVAKKYVESRKK